VRKLLIGSLLLTAGACTKRTTVVPPTTTPTPTTAAASQGTPRQALDTFLSAANAQDLQAMAGVWGASGQVCTCGTRVLVQETPEEITALVRAWRASIARDALGERPLRAV